MFDNLFVLTRTVLFSFLNADWKHAQQSGGALGVAGEFFASLFGTNTWPFLVDSSGEWSRWQIQELLNSHGIEMWGWGHSDGLYYFRVKSRQARWTQYILIRHGVPLRGRLLPQYSPTDSSAPHNSHPPTEPQTQSAKAPSDFIDVINSFVDKMGGD